MGIFLLSLAFVLAFVPGLLQPFTGGTQAETPAVNRVADDLSQRLLGNASEPYSLDGDCTRKFFESGSFPECGFDATTVQERVGVVDHRRVNVTIRGDLDDSGASEIVCWDGSGYVERSDCSATDSGTVRLSRGAKPLGSGGKTVSARRVALLDGADVTIEVVMW